MAANHRSRITHCFCYPIRLHGVVLR